MYGIKNNPKCIFLHRDSTFPFPACLLRTSYSLPTVKEEGLWTLEKIPLFLFRARDPPVTAAEYLLGGIGQDESGDHVELPSPIQCSVKVKIPDSAPILMNISNCQIIPLGHMCKNDLASGSMHNNL